MDDAWGILDTNEYGWINAEEIEDEPYIQINGIDREDAL